MNRRGNGLTAEAYTPLIDLSPRLADLMLRALRQAGIAAYASALPDEAQQVDPSALSPAEEPLERLYVDSDRGHAAEAVLKAQLSRLSEGGSGSGGGSPASSASPLDPPDGIELDADDGGRSGHSASPGPAPGGVTAAGPSSDPAPSPLPGSEESPESPESAGSGEKSGADPAAGLDEAAIWAEIVAAYETEFSDGVTPWPEEENLRPATDEDAPDDGDRDDHDGSGRTGQLDGEGRLPTARVIKAADPEPDPDDLLAESDDEHFVPPPPPPLPSGDPVTRFGWAALVGGPIYFLIAVLLGWEVPGWAAFTAVAAFIGGFVTLVLRMGDDPREPGDGAVV